MINIFRNAFLFIPLLIFSGGTAGAVVQRGDVTGSNPFETYLCPVIGVIRNYGVVALILFTVLIGLLYIVSDKTSEDKGVTTAIKSLMYLVAGVGILLMVYFLFEENIIDLTGVNLCTGVIG